MKNAGHLPDICCFRISEISSQSVSHLLVSSVLGPPSMLCVLVQVDHSTAGSMGMRSYNHTSRLKKVNLLGILCCYLVTSQSSAWI